MRMRKETSFLFAVLCLATTASLAQRAPSAGQLLQQAEPPKRLPSTEAPPTAIEERVGMPAGNGSRFQLKGVRLTGNQAFTEQQLLPLIQNGIGKTLSLGELDALTRRITDYYRQHGYLVARAYLPPQEIQDGTVTIAVLEGRIGEVVLNNPAGVANSALAPAQRIQAGDPIHNEELEGALLRLADLPGVAVTSTLRPGATVGTSDFLVDVAPGRVLAGSVDLSNFGNRYTAATLLGGSLYWNNLAGIGDQLSLRAQTGGSKFNYGRIGYQLPVGQSATRIGVALSRMNYKLGKEFAPLDAGGDATVASLYLLHPLLRSRDSNWYATLQYDDKRLEDRVDAASTESDKRVHELNIGIAGNFIDGLGGGGANNASLTYTAGRLDLDSVSARIDALSARSEGSFGKWAGAFQRLQRLPANLTLFLNANGQWSDRNLDSSEKMFLGGAGGVRAYPQGEASGDSGYLLNVELRYPLGYGWEAVGFYDRGQVRINHSPWIGAADNQRALAGYGIGANYVSASFSLSVYAAWKAGTGQPTSDVDRTPRVWAQAGYQF